MGKFCSSVNSHELLWSTTELEEWPIWFQLTRSNTYLIHLWSDTFKISKIINLKFFPHLVQLRLSFKNRSQYLLIQEIRIQTDDWRTRMRPDGWCEWSDQPSQEKEMQKQTKRLSEWGIQIAKKRNEVKAVREERKERAPTNAEFQKIAREMTKVLSEQCKGNRGKCQWMGKGLEISSIKLRYQRDISCKIEKIKR